MKAAEKELIYLYCVTDKAPKIKDLESLSDNLYSRTKDFGSGTYSVHHNSIYAVVCKVKEREFSEENLEKNLGDLEWIKAKVGMHEAVIEGVMKDTCVIPFKFGTIFNAEDSLKAMLDEHAQDFKVNLKNLEGKEEWGVKIYCDIKRLKAAVIKEEDGILKIDEEINSSSSGKAYFLKKKKEELIKDAASRKINKYGEACFEILKGLSIEARINKLLPKEVTEREDDMVLNSAFLVDKTKVEEFIEATDNLRIKYNGEGFSFDCTGPWPPYNFCQRRLPAAQAGMNTNKKQR